jgi:hypothetical protein
MNTVPNNPEASEYETSLEEEMDNSNSEDE